MPCSTLRRVVGASTVACALAVLAVLVPACSSTVAVTYPGNNVVKYAWRPCGMFCASAFAELEDTHDATGKECEDLINKADGSGGGTDNRVTAAALFDSAILLTLRGNSAEASARLAKAVALDPDPLYVTQQHALEDSAQRFLSNVDRKLQ
jgi:hypothetical protein